jgi:hypothetical protein
MTSLSQQPPDYPLAPKSKGKSASLTNWSTSTRDARRTIRKYTIIFAFAAYFDIVNYISEGRGGLWARENCWGGAVF